MSVVDQPSAESHVPGFFAGGVWRPTSGGLVHDVVSPVTEEVVASIPLASPADTDEAVRAAREAFDRGSWPGLSMQERAAYLVRIADGLEERLDGLAEAMVAELGWPLGAARQRAMTAVDTWRRTAEGATRLVTAEDRALAGDRVARVLRVPVGVVLVITPWNAPLPLASMKVAAALVAGCTVVLKPASEAPLTLPVLAEVITAAGVPDGVFNLVVASPEVTADLTRHDGVDMVTFTGSTRVGKEVMRACAEGMKRVALELGGKSASIVTEDVDPVATTPKLLAITGMALAGQTCASRNRILVPAAREGEWKEALADTVRGLRVGPPSDPEADLGPLATRAQRDRVEHYIEVGRSEGATLAVGGGRPAGLDRGWYVEPTLFTDVEHNMTIAQEEIFGPVLTVIPYQDDAEAVAISNSTIYGLSGAVFCAEPARGLELAQGVRAGTFQINTVGSLLDGPFGGMKQSGIGRESGLEGIAEFCEVRQIQFPAGALPPAGSEG